MLKTLSRLFKCNNAALTREDIQEKSFESIIDNESRYNDGDTRQPDFRHLWSSLTLDESAIPALKWICKRIKRNMNRYETVEAATGVPWWFIAAIHCRESGLSFEGVFHNGEKIIGTKKLTLMTPIDRGPFSSWEESAIDALKLMEFDQYQKWDVLRTIERAERYNGLGYRKHGVYSPYLFAGTNHSNERGKYTSDGTFVAGAIEKQVGICAILKALEENL